MANKLYNKSSLAELVQQLNLDYFLVLDESLKKVYFNESIDADLITEISNLGLDFIEKNESFSLNNELKLLRKKMYVGESSLYFFKFSEDIHTKFISDLKDDNILKIFNSIPDGITIVKNKTVIFRNNKQKSILAIKETDAEVHPLNKFLDNDSVLKLEDSFLRESNDILELSLVNDIGQKKIVKAIINTFKQDNDCYHIISVSDITFDKELTDRLNSEKEYLTQTLKSIKEGVIICDNDNKITLFNEFASVISGYHEEEVLNKNVTDVIKIINSENLRIDYSKLGDYKNDNAIIISKDELYRHISINISSIYGLNNNILGKVIVIIDMSEIKKRESEILYLSYHDVLTGIYNRTFLEFELKRLDTKRQLPFAIVMGDVNGLKVTNDVFGHRAGDILLKKVAEVLKLSCRQEDIIGRWGGDEFVILLPNTTEEEAFVVMKRIMREFNELSVSDSVNGLIPSMSLGYGIKLSVDEDIYSILRIAENNMYKRKMLSAESIYSSIITSMKTALFEKSNETEDHTNRLYSYCHQIGIKYSLSDDEFNDLELLCMLHDIGKIGISDLILKKPGKLTSEEWVEMKTHPEIGFRIAQATPELKKVANYILYHHEKFDGTGYPIGLAKYDIPLIDRILSVVDAFDAMTNNRTYREAMSVEDAIEEIKANSGTQFDPEVVKIFIESII